MSDTKNTIRDIEKSITESEAAKIKLPKYTNKKVQVVADCWKCLNRSGRYGYAGVCWACNGTGTQFGTSHTKVFPEGSTPEQIATWTAEIERRAEVRRMKNQLKKLVVKAQKEEAAVTSANDLLDANPGLVEALRLDHKISRDLREKLFKFGSLSEKQIALAFNLKNRAEEQEKENAKALPAPEGRHIVEGVVLCVKIQDSQFGSTLKMLVKDERGFKVWTSVPKSLDPVKGDSVRIKVTLSPKKDDPKFAFGSRPVAA